MPHMRRHPEGHSAAQQQMDMGQDQSSLSPHPASAIFVLYEWRVEVVQHGRYGRAYRRHSETHTNTDKRMAMFR